MCERVFWGCLETSQQAAVKSSERRQTIALWTLNVSPWQVIVKSEPFPDSRRLPKDCASAELATLLGDEVVLSMVGDFLGANSSIERRFVS